MRRNEREIKDMQDIVSVIEGCQVMRLAIPDEPAPYLVPLNFGFERTEQGVAFYFHSAVAGRKVELLRRQPTVGFELDHLIQIVEKETPCGWTARYELSLIHIYCSVRSMTTESASFWAQATVAKGWGRSPTASGFSFKTAATSAASDLYSKATSVTGVSWAFKRYWIT